MLFSTIFIRECCESRHFVSNFGKVILFLSEVNANGYYIVNLCWFSSCNPKPKITPCETLCLYLSQYGESKLLIFLFPNRAYQFIYTNLSQFYSPVHLGLTTFKLHQHLWFYGSLYLFLNGSKENVGDLYVVSVRIDIA